jgi:hypothetical protein
LGGIIILKIKKETLIMQTIMNYLNAHPYVFLGLIAGVFIYMVWLYFSIIGWCIHTIQNPTAGFFKKGFAVMIGMLLFKNVMGFMNRGDDKK